MLLTSGCSFVWGDELPGFDENPPCHWDYTFTHLLSEKLNTNHINLSSCGGCNDKIFRDIIDYLSDPKNIVPTHMVIIWTAWQRGEVSENIPLSEEVSRGLKRNLNMSQYSSRRLRNIYNKNIRNVLEIYYGSSYDFKTDLIHGLSKIKSMEIICESKGINLIQGVFHKTCWSNLLSILKYTEDDKEYPGKKEQIEWIKESLGNLKPNSRLGMGKYKDFFTVAKENNDVLRYGHPGIKSNKKFSEILFKIFSEKEI